MLGVIIYQILNEICLHVTYLVRVRHNGDGASNGQNGWWTHFVHYSDDDKNNKGHRLKNVKQTVNMSIEGKLQCFINVHKTSFWCKIKLVLNF